MKENVPCGRMNYRVKSSFPTAGRTHMLAMADGGKSEISSLAFACRLSMLLALTDGMIADVM